MLKRKKKKKLIPEESRQGLCIGVRHTGAQVEKMALHSKKISLTFHQQGKAIYATKSKHFDICDMLSPGDLITKK